MIQHQNKGETLILLKPFAYHYYKRCYLQTFLHSLCFVGIIMRPWHINILAWSLDLSIVQVYSGIVFIVGDFKNR